MLVTGGFREAQGLWGERVTWELNSIGNHTGPYRRETGETVTPLMGFIVAQLLHAALNGQGMKPLHRQDAVPCSACLSGDQAPL